MPLSNGEVSVRHERMMNQNSGILRALVRCLVAIAFGALTLVLLSRFEWFEGPITRIVVLLIFFAVAFVGIVPVAVEENTDKVMSMIQKKEPAEQSDAEVQSEGAPSE